MIESLVTSFVNGRVRLRHPIFKDSQAAHKVTEALQTVNGIAKLEHNARTGSILIQYDEEILEQDNLISLLKQGVDGLDFELNNQPIPKPTCCIPASFKKLTTREKRKIYNRTMAVSLGISALAIGVGNERIHAIAGCVFLGLSLGHIKRMHKGLL